MPKPWKGKQTLYLDLEDIKALNEIAAAEDSSASRIVRLLVRDFLAKRKGKRRGHR